MYRTDGHSIRYKANGDPSVLNCPQTVTEDHHPILRREVEAAIQTHKQSHAADHTEQTEATSGEDHRSRTGRLQSRKECHRADLQPTHSM